MLSPVGHAGCRVMRSGPHGPYSSPAGDINTVVTLRASRRAIVSPESLDYDHPFPVPMTNCAMSLDLLTLSITLTCAAVLSALVLFLIWRIDRELAGVFHWMLGSLFIGLAFLSIFMVGLLGLSGNLDAFVSNALSLPAVLLVVEGSLRFRGYHSERRWRAGLALVPFLILMAWWLRDAAQARYVFHDAVSALGLGAAGVIMIWRNRDPMERRAYMLAAGSAFLLAAAFSARWAVAATAPDASAVSLDMPASLALYFSLILFSIGWTYGVAIACYYHSNQHVMELARRDPLTGLPNRRSIDEEFNRVLLESRRSGRSFAVILMDINDFKIANDRFGHAVGDQVLTTIGQRLDEFVREADFAGRLGGDEFIVIARDIGDPEAGGIVRQRLTEAVEGAVQLPGEQWFEVRISAGVALWGIDGETADALMKAADRRMYRDKSHHATIREA